jgi:hypothetical protein
VHITVTDSAGPTNDSTRVSTQVDDPTVEVGEPMFDVATVSYSADPADNDGDGLPTGAVTFDLYGPDDDTCSGTPVFTSTRELPESLQVTSGSYTPSEPGTYRWVATYSGDATYFGVSEACNAPNETVVVSDEDDDNSGGGGNGGEGDRDDDDDSGDGDESDDDDDDDKSGGELPDTGAPADRSVLLTGLALLVAGIAVMHTVRLTRPRRI